MYADEYGGYGSGMNTGNFRNGGAGNGSGGARFGGNERGLFIVNYTFRDIFHSLRNSLAGSGGSRFSDRGGSRGGFNDRRGNGNGMDRRGGGNGGMRDYVDPWAHNGSSGNSPMMGGSGPLNNFSLGNGNGNGMSNMSLNSNAGPNNGNNGGGFGGSNMDIDKTSTQVTIPKDVS